MVSIVLGEGPPSSPQTPPEVVTSTVWQWLQYTLYVVDALAIAAVIVLGALLVLDRERGQAISSTSAHVEALKIFLGVLIASSAVTIAMWFA